MPREARAASDSGLPRHRLPEAMVALMAVMMFLGCLGSVDLWGKREQRAAAEAIDTIEHDHWLVAQIQGRPRLEKPPLPRWSIAALSLLTGRRDEAVIRLPGALSGLATVALVYALGRRMGGRALGLAAAFVLTSTGFFVGEMRQASNDGPLALFVTLALYAAWRLLDDDDSVRAEDRNQRPRSRRTRVWSVIFHAALGLGFLTKGPVILLLVAVAIIPYLTFSRQRSHGARRLVSGWGFLLFVTLAVSWPVAVMLRDPSALQVWWLEMGEKTGLSQILEHRRHAMLLLEWPAMVLPWTLVGVVAVVLPFFLERAPGHGGPAARALERSGPSSYLWYAWWWAMGNLIVFCRWAVAKPNYYLPCLPGMALLVGATWVYLSRTARGGGAKAQLARAILQTHWVILFVAATLGPLVAREWLPAALWPFALAIGVVMAAAVFLSVLTWRRGADALALAPLVAGSVFGVLIAYGVIAPAENPERSHRVLAQRLQNLLSPGVQTVMFFNEIDEGLWFYLSGLDLTPVPGSHPRYNIAYDLAHSYLTERRGLETITDLEAKRQARDKQTLFNWLEQDGARPSYLLLRRKLYDLMADDLGGRVFPLLRETGLKRTELVLLELAVSGPTARAAATPGPTRR
jgi:4-amino-4-deoxy-L-arabinose transferase-like glycosyltransferase